MSGDPLIGATLDGRYRIEAALGRGGMGTVYRAVHAMLDRRVAVKVLHPKLTNDAAATKRFIREAQHTFRFDHANCVRVTDFGATPEGVLYLVMDHLDGRTVGEELRVDGALESNRVAHILAQVADALSHAHGLGLVHRDLKPDNLMLIARNGDPDFVKVLDFGLAKLWDEDGGGLSTVFSLSPLTQKGITFGTPQYMSPEQARGESLEPPSDIYALGVIGFEMLTARVPFDSPRVIDVLTQHITNAPPPINVPGADSRLIDFIMACLAKNPRSRPGPALEVANSLRALSSDQPVTRRVSAPTLELHATPVPPAAPTLAPSLDTRAVIARGVRQPRWPYVVLAAGVGALGMVAFSFFNRSSASRPVHTEERVDAAPRAAAPPDASSPAVATAADAAPEVAKPDAASSDTASKEPTRRDESRKELRDLLARARAEKSNPDAAARIRQTLAANAALKLSPRNAQAHYLLGDALVRSGDKVLGCKHLALAARLPAAVAMRTSAGCGTSER